MFKTVWQDFVAPLLRRPARFQVAALCYRHGETGPEVLLITSLHTHRWILPKGWPKRGFDGGGVAAEEAWEEAGVRASSRPPRRIGRYRYTKRLRGDVPVGTEVDVYAIEVGALRDSYPEEGRRQRRWMTPDGAAEAVDEPDLSALLRRTPDLLAQVTETAGDPA
ncbi:NUDIX hydrolase [Histidinibacterium aquaticum]|uniref:NUDIX hydrolase n=1 Tax=Histidinibacterium aquaticum TaxID=2613962 RepID=A0A5J5GSW2_9RHOB|nr:NUDIX hydrolase [Histidinibacterium aquaticum]KAA9010624.1 NUDIX hydrolase [Histidinibacterium aquaticum]